MTDSAAAPNSVASGSSSLDVVLAAARAGAADATEAAGRVWSRSGLYVSRAVYIAAYGISFGVVFPAALLVRTIPVDNAAVRGLIEGAQAAARNVDSMLGRTLEAPAAH
jgi:hypothetical protein